MPSTFRSRFTAALKLVAKGAALLVVLTAAVSIWGTVQTPVERPAAANIVNDVTQINPVAVARIVAPTTASEIIAAVKSHKGPISIGGGRYSMGGQTATEQALQIDMRHFNKVVAFSRESKTITVQAGIRWREIQDYIDRHDLSVKIMQTYSNFTVGGSLSVNVHGRYVGFGPLIYSVNSLQVVLPDGSLVAASPTIRPEIFYGVIGGYGGLGVITEATLQLEDNVKVERQAAIMPIGDYKDYFFRNIRESKSMVFHNADIYPDKYETVHAVSYGRTDKAVTVQERLIPKEGSYALDRFVYWVISEWPFGKEIRQYIVDPILFRGSSVRWRNYEASYDAAELEPASRQESTYVLQEYFVPVERFDDFIPKMRMVFRAHNVNVINVSIRHAHKDPGAILAWAPTEVFAFVVYYKQNTEADAKRKVGVWTREMTEAVLSVGGSYYLPYQPHATDEQFLRAYPRAPEFFALKKRLDPGNKFRNKLWDKYYGTRAGEPAASLAADVRRKLAQKKGYLRDGGQTYLAHPEWYIVYSSDEYAAWLKDRMPSGFPYVASIGQYWTNYREVSGIRGTEYPANPGYEAMLWVIGVSYSLEMTVKSLYENTIGRLSEWTADGGLTEEDHYAHRVAKDYGDFIHIRPWYEYNFGGKLLGLWRETPPWGPHAIRKWERRFILTLEYGVKAGYGWLIKVATGAAYEPEDDRMQMVVANWRMGNLTPDNRIVVIEALDQTHMLVATPRYDSFRDTLLEVARKNARLEILEIAGNREILLTGLAPSEWQYGGSRGRVMYSLPVPTDGSRKRIAMRIPNAELIEVLRELQREANLVIDHIYDY